MKHFQNVSLYMHCFGINCIVVAKMLFTVAVWSAVNVAGTRLRDLDPDIGTPDDSENWEQVHVEVINRYACSVC